MCIWTIVIISTDDKFSPFFQNDDFDWLVNLQYIYAVYPLVSFVLLATGLFLIPVIILLCS